MYSKKHPVSYLPKCELKREISESCAGYYLIPVNYLPENNKVRGGV